MKPIYPLYNYKITKTSDHLFYKTYIETYVRVLNHEDNKYYLQRYYKEYEYLAATPEIDIIKELLDNMLKEVYLIINLSKVSTKLISSKDGSSIFELDPDQRSEPQRIHEDILLI